MARRQGRRQQSRIPAEFSIEERVYNGLLSSKDTSAVIYSILLPLAISTQVVPKGSGMTAAAMYIGLSVLARSVISEDDNDDDDNDHDEFGNDNIQEPNDDITSSSSSSPPVYLLAFVAAMLTAGILPTWYSDSEVWSIYAPVTACLVFAGVALLRIENSNQEKENTFITMREDDDDVDKENFLPDPVETERRIMKLWDDNFRKQLTPDEDDTKKNN
ncbi:hypothetical protein IV203_029311 [Nitzschia inconspicua]|uniref:Uncharacterized protein n=1 Tax=Nitzschia inconspicua TaxID=303405 RepID=A0A9K3Q0U2_9STRA|nr:hypothetical protein IV203_029311 [Nitzschia inconspicua]